MAEDVSKEQILEAARELLKQTDEINRMMKEFKAETREHLEYMRAMTRELAAKTRD